MSNIAISVRNVSKGFAVYNNPHDRLKEIFSIRKKTYHNTFWALKNITFDITHGNIVGIIGRNGAGKSTLLKAITGTLTPTSGQVEVNGKVSAILELGTGFYPEFTGYKNIYLNARMLGLTKKEVDSRIKDIIEFSELEDFIHQPVKTYSSGMYARLAFSVAAFLDSEVMIIDEALSVGDMYFVHKCFNRLKEICESGRTVLFVSHDLSYVQRLCDRVVWIENGEIIKDGPALEVAKQYSAFIREQEEIKLRRKSEKQNVIEAEHIPTKPILFHLVADEAHPRHELPISKIMLKNEEIEYKIDVGSDWDSNPQPTGPCGFVILGEGAQPLMDWGPAYRIDGRTARNYSDCQGTMAHAPFRFNIPENCDYKDLFLEVEFKDQLTEPVYCEMFVDNKYVRLGEMSTGDKDSRWKNVSFDLNKIISEQHIITENEKTSVAEERATSADRWGIGKMFIDKVRFTGFDREKFIYNVGEKITIYVDYSAEEDVSDPVVVVVVYRLDGIVAFQHISSLEGYSFGKIKKGTGTISLEIEENHLGVGHYVVSAALFPQLDLLDKHMQKAYDLHDRKHEFKVVEDTFCAYDLGIVRQRAKWRHSITNRRSNHGLL